VVHDRHPVRHALPLLLALVHGPGQLLGLSLQAHKHILTSCVLLAVLEHLRTAEGQPTPILVLNKVPYRLLGARVFLYLLLPQVEDEAHIVPLMLLFGLVIFEAVADASALRHCLDLLAVNARDEGLALGIPLPLLRLCAQRGEGVHDQGDDGVQNHDTEHHEVTDIVSEALKPVRGTRHDLSHYAAEAHDAVAGALVEDVLRACHDALVAEVAEVLPEVMKADCGVDEGDDARAQNGHQQ